VEWLDAQSAETLYLTTVSLAEIRYGIAALPRGRRRTRLHELFEAQFVPVFAGRILSFDEHASATYGDLRAKARAAGKAIGDFDALIAAIASSREFVVATRDTSPFEAAGVEVVNPFV
jgi:hypothetical protein